jgi:hypothetical protein
MSAPERPLRLHVTVYGDTRSEVRDAGEFDASWEDGERLFIRWRGARYPLRSERKGGRHAGDDDWIRVDDELRADDRFFIYWDD